LTVFMKFYIFRELYEKGKEAFVSYIRAYSKHECSYLLRVKEIDFAKLALGFGLLHLPKMPEIKKSTKYENFQIEYSSIPYKFVLFLS
jgi:ATP-dependent RNA helicase DDX55/SPB4